MNGSQTAVLELIRRYDGACGRHFANHNIGRFGARIFELKQMGYRFVKYPCRHHKHQHYVPEYQLLATPPSKGSV